MRMFPVACGRFPSARRLCGVLAAGILLLGGAMSPPAAAHEFKAGSIAIGHPWSRATPPAATIGAGYMTLANGGTVADRLVGMTSPAASRLEVHAMSVEDGVMRMRRIEDAIEIPAGGTVSFEPGGLHLMLVGLARPLVEGESVPVTLTFEKAGAVEVTLAIDRLGATAPGGQPADDGAHSHAE